MWRVIGVAAVVLVVVAAVTDVLLKPLSDFWSQHSMLTNLVASGVFTAVTVTVIERWLKNQEQRQRDAREEEERQRLEGREREEQRRLAVVRSVAYNAVARGPIAQRRIMWFLLHGGELRFVPEFRISDEHMHELCRILARLDLTETSEHDVMDEVTDRPCSAARFDVLAQDRHWRRLVHEVLLDVVHTFRALVARWSALLPVAHRPGRRRRARRAPPRTPPHDLTHQTQSLMVIHTLRGKAQSAFALPTRRWRRRCSGAGDASRLPPPRQDSNLREHRSVHPTWHCTNPNLQVDGLPFAVSRIHSKLRRDGYRRPG